MLEYWKTFLNEINLLLSYFVKFSKDNTIVSKKYLSYCVVIEPKKDSYHDPKW